MQWCGERVRLLARGAMLVGVDEIHARARHREDAHEERAHAVESAPAVALTERIVQKAVQHVPLFFLCTEPVEKCMLPPVAHDPVGSRNQELRRQDRLASVTTRSAAACSPAGHPPNRPRQQRSVS
jgi:hypothetical protein